MSGVNEQKQMTFDDVWPSVEEKLEKLREEHDWSDALYGHYRMRARQELKVMLELGFDVRNRRTTDKQGSGS